MDRYLHDAVLDRSVAMLYRKPPPAELAAMRRRIEKRDPSIRKKPSPKARPGYRLKRALQDEIHKRTFQRPEEVLAAADMQGVDDFWNKVAAGMVSTPTSATVEKTLGAIVRRRNQIVHEADLTRKIIPKQWTLRGLSVDEATDWVSWIREFTEAADAVFVNEATTPKKRGRKPRKP